MAKRYNAVDGDFLRRHLNWNGCFLALWLNPVMFNNIDGIIQFQECSNVISACHILQSVQVRFQRRIDMVLFNFSNNCKHNIWDWLLMKFFKDLFSNQKGWSLRSAIIHSCMICYVYNALINWLKCWDILLRCDPWGFVLTDDACCEVSSFAPQMLRHRLSGFTRKPPRKRKS